MTKWTPTGPYVVNLVIDYKKEVLNVKEHMALKHYPLKPLISPGIGQRRISPTVDANVLGEHN